MRSPFLSLLKNIYVPGYYCVSISKTGIGPVDGPPLMSLNEPFSYFLMIKNNLENANDVFNKNIFIMVKTGALKYPSFFIGGRKTFEKHSYPVRIEGQ